MAAGDQFGVAVSLSGDTAVVGARGHGCRAGDYCGLAYVFRFNETSWVQVQTLTASDQAPGDFFGTSVSVSGERAVVGALGDACTAGVDCGSAYVFRFNATSWVEEQKLTASDAAAGDIFGRSVSVSGDTVVVGAGGNACAVGFDCGAAYVFDCPRCGNGKLDPGEECDATDDVACPGACQKDCTCGPFCGNHTCDSGEDSCSCSADCGLPPSSELPNSTCSDGLDNDCDVLIDSDDPDCPEQPLPTITQWGMIFLALLLLATGKIVFRKTVNSLSSM